MSKIRLHGSSSGYMEIAPPAAGSSATITLPNSAGEVLLSDGSAASLTQIPAANIVGVCTAGLASSSGILDNTPGWLVRLSSNYSHTSTNTWVTAPLATEDHDTDGAFNTTTYKFTVPAGKAGKYFLYYHQQANDNPDDGENIQGRIDKNGSALDFSYSIAISPASNKTTNVHHSFVTTLAVGDELTMHLYHHEGGTVTYSASQTYFGGYRLIMP